MTLVIGTHEVEDVAKWVSSPVRQSQDSDYWPLLGRRHDHGAEPVYPA